MKRKELNNSTDVGGIFSIELNFFYWIATFTQMMENTIDSIGAAVYVYELAYRAVRANTEHTH